MPTQTIGDALSSRAVPGGGQLLEYRTRMASQLRYFLFLPEQYGPQSRVLVAVHGISRNVDELLAAFIPYAQHHGVVLMLPVFHGKQCTAYQRLGSSGQRSDHMLDEMLATVEQDHNLDCRRFYLFGYSGGAQFAQRYTFAYPQRIHAVVLGAPGWFTMPDRRAAFPRGIGHSKRLPDLHLDPEHFLDVPSCVFVGARDTRVDKQLNCSPRIVQMQGRNRLQRAGRWVRAMQDAARARNKPTVFARQVLPEAGHSFSQCVARGRLAKRTFECLFATADSDGIREARAPVATATGVCA